ncbi:MAG: DMT family transporter [Pseudomonadota bacterium]
MRKPILSYIDLTVAQVGIAMNVIIGKYLLDFMPIYLYVCMRFILTTLFFAAIIHIYRIQASALPENMHAPVSRRDMRLMIGQGLTGGFLFNVLMLYGLMYTTATSAGIVTSSFPAVLAIISFWLLGEQISRNKKIGIALAVIGILILSLGSEGAHGAAGKNAVLSVMPSLSGVFGDSLVFLAMIPEALYSIFAKLMNGRIKPLYAAFIANLSAAVMLLPLAIYSGWSYDWASFTPFLFGVVALAAVFSGLFYALWFRALCYVPASTAALFGGVLPVATALAAMLILHESFTVYAAVGMIFVLASLYIGTRRQNARII